MAKKKNNGGGGENKNTTSNGGAGGGGGGGGGEKKKDDSVLTVVLKLDMHCEGCATKIKKSIRSLEGVEVVKGGDGELMKLTVIGKVDPAKVREAVEKKAKKKVELVSLVPPKKENKNEDSNKENKIGNDKNGGGGEKKDGGGEKKSGGGEKKSGGGEKQAEKKGEDSKKAKELPMSTTVMRLNLHCHGCIQKIRKIITKTKGYLDMSIDEEKNQITVKGTIDMKSLAQTLTEKLRKIVEIVPPKKEADKKENVEKEKPKEKENTGGGGKGKGGGGGGDTGGGEVQRLVEYVQYGYPNPAVFGYGYGYQVEQSHTSQMFSDENPNACSVM